MKRAGLLVCVFVFAVAGIARADRDTDTKHKKVYVWHGGKIARAKTERGSLGPITKDQHFLVHWMSDLTVVLADYNPFLFTYSWDTKTSDSENEKQAAVFASVLGKFAGLLPKADGSPAPALDAASTINNLDIGKLTTALVALDDILEKLPEKLDETATIVSKADVDEIIKGQEKFRDDIKTWSAAADAVAKQYDNLDEIRKVCRTGAGTVTVDGVPGVSCTDNNVRNVLDSIDAYENDARKGIDVVQKFVKTADNFKPVEGKTVGWSVKDTSVIITAAADDTFSEYFGAKAKGAQTGALKETTVPIGPYSPVSIKVGPALVYSRVRNPTITAVQEGDHYAAKIEEGEFSGYNIAAMATVSPSYWRGPVYLNGQFGITPEKDTRGFYVGGSVSFFEKFVLGVGWINQKVRALDGPQTFAKPDDLKTTTVSKDGVYFTFTYNP